MNIEFRGRAARGGDNRGQRPPDGPISQSAEGRPGGSRFMSGFLHRFRSFFRCRGLAAGRGLETLLQLIQSVHTFRMQIAQLRINGGLPGAFDGLRVVAEIEPGCGLHATNEQCRRCVNRLQPGAALALHSSGTFLRQPAEMDPELGAVILAWSQLAPSIRSAILRLVCPQQ